MSGAGGGRAPRDGYVPYFAALNRLLRRSGGGRPAMLLDLDRVDANLAVIRGAFADSSIIRVVAKSLPSPSLLGYVMERLGTRRLMAFHLPFLPTFLTRLAPDTEILLGKTLPSEGIAAFLQSLDVAQRRDAAARISWLADSSRRVDEIAALAGDLGLTLRVAVEVDVGLHRGGPASPAQLQPVLDALLRSSGALVPAGLMGYDGHVAHAPAFTARGRTRAVGRAFRRMTDRYRALVDAYCATVAIDESTRFNSGGSGSFRLFGAASSTGGINDVALGGAALRPATYPGPSMDGLQPALWIATPLIRRLPLEVPLVERLGRIVTALRPSLREALFVYGGGWAAHPVAPTGLHVPASLSDPPNQNLVPNISLLTARPSISIQPGEWVFYHPIQSDAIFQFEEIGVVREGEIVARWPAMPRRF